LKEIMMKTILFSIGSLLLLMIFGSSALAQNQRSFLSGMGLDTNTCGPTNPCRTFARAISQTNTGGEIVVLTSAGYGPFSISQPVSIIAAPGIYAGISVTSGDGIDINAGTGTVILRGLTVNNQGGFNGFTNGINFTGNGILHVENCVVSGFNFGTALESTGGGALEVKDSIFRGNSNGIFVRGSSSTVVVDHVRLEENTDGLEAEDVPSIVVWNSLISGNETGLYAVSNVGPVQMTIESCLVCYNASGIQVYSGAAATPVVRVSNTTVTDNGIVGDLGFLEGGGLAQGLGTGPSMLLSRGNNTVGSNTVNTSGTIGSYPAK
jgi:hypothetical protein